MRLLINSPDILPYWRILRRMHTLALLMSMIACALSTSVSFNSSMVPSGFYKDSPPVTGEPIQLVGSDGKGGLTISKAGLDVLNKLDSSVHVVSVVGKFHTGKSFLLNQLMGLGSGMGFSVDLTQTRN